MAQNKDETTWFDGVTWVEVCTEAGNSTNKTSCTADVYSNKKRKKVAGGNELKLGLLLVFPADIIRDILSRLPAEDLIRGRVICKSWYKLTKDPQFIHLQVSKAIGRPPSFLLDEYDHGRVKTLVLVDRENDKWRSKEIMLKTIYKTVMNLSNSCNGLVCISANFTGHDPVTHNLLTKDCLVLPNSDYKPHQSFSCRTAGCGIGFDLMNKKYKVVRVYNIYEDISAHQKLHTKAEIITLGESSWRILNFPHTVTTHCIKKPVFLNGALHWLIHREKDCSHSDHVLVLDCMNETFETIKFPPVELPEDLDLINLGETLALSEFSRFDSDVHKVWQIVGNRRDGGRLRQYTFDRSLLHGHFDQKIQLLGMLGNGDFLYKALERGIVHSPGVPLQYHLVFYSPQMKTAGISVELPDIQNSVNVCFVNASFFHFVEILYDHYA